MLSAFCLMCNNSVYSGVSTYAFTIFGFGSPWMGECNPSYSPGSITDGMAPSLQLLPEGDVARLEFTTIDSSSSEVFAAFEDDDFDFLVMPFRRAVTARVSIFIMSRLSYFKVESLNIHNNIRKTIATMSELPHLLLFHSLAFHDYFYAHSS